MYKYPIFSFVLYMYSLSYVSPMSYIAASCVCVCVYTHISSPVPSQQGMCVHTYVDTFLQEYIGASPRWGLGDGATKSRGKVGRNGECLRSEQHWGWALRWEAPGVSCKPRSPSGGQRTGDVVYRGAHEADRAGGRQD